jgi:hypothetical protein
MPAGPKAAPAWETGNAIAARLLSCPHSATSGSSKAVAVFRGEAHLLFYASARSLTSAHRFFGLTLKICNKLLNLFRRQETTCPVGNLIHTIA